MNYIQEINGFYAWLETHRLPPAAVNLWHALMHAANRARWPDEITVPLSVLEAKTGLKRDNLYRARRALEDAGRIQVAARPGRQSAAYRIVPFVSHIPTQSQNVVSHISTQNQVCVAHSDTNPAVVSQYANIYKQVNKDLNSGGQEGEGTKGSNQKQADGFAVFYAAYPRKQNRGDAEKAWEALNPDRSLLARMLAALEVAKKSSQWTKEGGQFIPFPAKWLRSKGWEDEYTPAEQPDSTRAAMERMYGKNASGPARKPPER